MHDIRWIRDNPVAFDEALRNRKLEPESGRLIALDEQRRAAVASLQALQERRNDASKQIGRAKARGNESRVQELMAEVSGIKERMPADEEALKRIEKELQEVLAGIPNVPTADVPVGLDESANVELRKVGEPRQFNFAPRPFTPKQHFELGEALGLMDFETAAKLSGARFVVLKGALARLERALATFMLDIHTSEHGYTEVAPPLLVRDDTMFGTAQLPKFELDQFETYKGFDDPIAALWKSMERTLEETGLTTDDMLDEQGKPSKHFMRELKITTDRIRDEVSRLWLIPTAEVALTNLVREAIADEDALPLRVTADTPCFRAEAGAAGRDTRGMIRMHQFRKVELVSVTTPEQSETEHERMTHCAEEILRRLRLPFRTVLLSTGDMGFAARKTYDIEVWLPGQNAYREISSCSNCGDFQARRMNARYRPKGEKSPRFVHTLNGSGVAVGRALVAVLENCQEADGSIAIPDALKPYMGGLETIGRA